MKQTYIKCMLIVSLLLICVLNVILINNNNIETFDNSNDTTKILYIIRSIPKYYDERLNMQFKTWMKQLNENDDVLVASENKDHIDKFNLKYSTPTCPKDYDIGVCCSESNAIVKALKEYEFDWVFILDDNVYVYPDKVRSIINKYKDNYNVALGTSGCESNGVEGLCGGGGYAFSKQALQKIVSNDYDLFLKEYKISCEKTKFHDITMGELATKNNIEIIDIPEFKPWGIDTDEKQLIIDNKIATLHYHGGDITKHKKTIEGKMNFLQSLYSQIKEMFVSVTERFTNTSNNEIINYTTFDFKNCNRTETHSCLFTNIYLYNHIFYILCDESDVNNKELINKLNKLLLYSYGGSSFNYKLITKEHFDTFTYETFEKIKQLCVRYNTAWRHNPGHALWDSLYSIYVILLCYKLGQDDFYNILFEEDKEDKGWLDRLEQSTEFIQTFSGLDNKYFKKNSFKKNTLYCFDKLVTGIGKIGQRIYEYPVTLNIPGNSKYDAVINFVKRFYKKYNIGEHVKQDNNIKNIIIIDNKRFTDKDKQVLKNIINTFAKDQHISIKYINFKDIPLFKEQLNLISNTDIYISSVGTSLMLHPFLRPGSIVINLGEPYKTNSSIKKYDTVSKYWESYMCESTNYLKCDYYKHKIFTHDMTFNEDYLIKLIKKNIQNINNYSIPVLKKTNLPEESKNFIDYCDKENCKDTIADMNSFGKDKWHCKSDAWLESILYGSGEWNEINKHKKKNCRVKYDKIKNYM